MPKQSWDDYGLALAAAAAGRSSCTRRSVGCAILDADRRVVSTGYNGAPAGLPECIDGACPRGRLDAVAPDSDYDHPGTPGFCIAVHAEPNALIYADAQRLRGGTAYITHAPCPGCTKLLAAAGISRAVWPDGECDPSARLREWAN